MTILLLAVMAGLAGLALGGELLVRGAVGIAHRLGISGLITGVVIVGSATSMPELVASVEAALIGSPGIAWGNIVGSNLANSLLILGAAALVAPIVMRGVGKRDAVVALASTLVVWAIAYTRLASPWIGALLLALLVVYVVWRLRHPPTSLEEDEDDAPRSTWIAAALFAAGLALLVGGGQLLVTGAVDLARVIGVSEAAIGLTVVAIGTSLPELAATVAAALRGRPDLAVGNVVGSNIYNLLLIGGATMAIAPVPIAGELLDFEWPVLAATALLMLVLCRYANRIGRIAGLLLLAAFGVNTALVFA